MRKAISRHLDNQQTTYFVVQSSHEHGRPQRDGDAGVDPIWSFGSCTGNLVAFAMQGSQQGEGGAGADPMWGRLKGLVRDVLAVLQSLLLEHAGAVRLPKFLYQHPMEHQHPIWRQLHNFHQRIDASCLVISAQWPFLTTTCSRCFSCAGLNL